MEFNERKKKSGIIIAGSDDTSKKDCKVVMPYEGCEICKAGDELILNPGGYNIQAELKDGKAFFIDEKDIVAIV